MQISWLLFATLLNWNRSNIVSVEQTDLIQLSFQSVTNLKFIQNILWGQLLGRHLRHWKLSLTFNWAGDKHNLCNVLFVC